MPLFLRLPAAFGQTTMMLTQDYVQTAQKAGMEPDEELFRPIVETMQAMPAAEGEEAAE